MTRDKNKIARVQQAQAWLDAGEAWNDVLFKDETTAALRNYADKCYRNKDHEVPVCTSECH